MKSTDGNPTGNSLPRGIDEEALLESISTSGYPLQQVVAAKLLPMFNVIEEWGYVDDSSGEHRSLDVRAFRQLDVPSKELVAPSLLLLIECKRSRHPLVFFRQVVARHAIQFPYIDWVPRRVALYQKGANASSEVWPADALGLGAETFVTHPPVCATFSKAIVTGKKVELSGSDPYNTIILPLLKAQSHSRITETDFRTGRLFPTLQLCVAVVDAPMLLVESPAESRDPLLCPWIRVVRHESSRDSSHGSRWRFHSVDIVHADFLDEFMTKYVVPFSARFADRVFKSNNLLRFGGWVNDLANWSWESIEQKNRA